jgi:peptide deformylase
MDFDLKMIRKPIARQVIIYPNTILQMVSKPVVNDIVTDEELQDVLDDMVFTLQANKAVGLAGIQIGVPLRILVVQDASQEPIKVINPVIKERDGSSWGREGCLSMPGLYLNIKRAKEVVVEYFNEKGELKTTVNDGLLGRAIEHEFDHLDGKMFFENLSKVERSIALQKYSKIKRKLNNAGLLEVA